MNNPIDLNIALFNLIEKQIFSKVDTRMLIEE